MTDHLEISRKLAEAIGWKPEQMDVYGDELWIERLHNLRRRFDYRDWNVIGPIATRFDFFPFLAIVHGKCYWATETQFADTPQLAIALAVIAAQGVK